MKKFLIRMILLLIILLSFLYNFCYADVIETSPAEELGYLSIVITPFVIILLLVPTVSYLVLKSKAKKQEYANEKLEEKVANDKRYAFIIFNILMIFLNLLLGINKYYPSILLILPILLSILTIIVNKNKKIVYKLFVITIIVTIISATVGLSVAKRRNEEYMAWIKRGRMSEQEIATYNSKFEAYLGIRSGTVARALCDVVRGHNNAHTDDETQNVKIAIGEAPESDTPPPGLVTAKEVNEIKSTLKAGKTYKVTLGYSKDSSLIVGVYIKEVE